MLESAFCLCRRLVSNPTLRRTKYISTLVLNSSDFIKVLIMDLTFPLFIYITLCNPTLPSPLSANCIQVTLTENFYKQLFFPPLSSPRLFLLFLRTRTPSFKGKENVKILPETIIYFNMQFVTQAVWVGRHSPSHTSPIKRNENHSFQYLFIYWILVMG